jgi:hypothetical protein
VLARFGKVEEADDAGVVETAHDLNFLEDVGALLRREGRYEERARGEEYEARCERGSVRNGGFEGEGGRDF